MQVSWSSSNLPGASNQLLNLSSEDQLFAEQIMIGFDHFLTMSYYLFLVSIVSCHFLLILMISSYFDLDGGFQTWEFDPRCDFV